MDNLDTDLGKDHESPRGPKKPLEDRPPGNSMGNDIGGDVNSVGNDIGGDVNSVGNDH